MRNVSISLLSVWLKGKIERKTDPLTNQMSSFGDSIQGEWVHALYNGLYEEVPFSGFKCRKGYEVYERDHIVG